jgi:hypothetical protein
MKTPFSVAHCLSSSIKATVETVLLRVGVAVLCIGVAMEILHSNRGLQISTVAGRTY